MRLPPPPRGRRPVTAIQLGLKAIQPTALRRVDGALIAIIACHLAAHESEQRWQALRHWLLAIDRPLQILFELAPLDPRRFCQQHAAATAGEPLAPLRRVAAALRAELQDYCRQSQPPVLTIYLVISQPAAPADAAGGTARPGVPATTGALIPAVGQERSATPAQLVLLDEACQRLLAAAGQTGIRAERLAGRALLELVRHSLRSGQMTLPALPETSQEMLYVG